MLARLVGLLAGVLLATATAVQAAPFAYVPSSFSNDVSVVDTATNTVLQRIPVGSSPFGVAVDPSSSHVYVTNFSDDTVSVLSTATNTVVGTITVQDGPFGVAVHPTGTRAYVANQLSDTVSVIDTAARTVMANIPVGGRPVGVAVNPAGTRLYVTNQWSGTVSVIDTATGAVVATVGVGAMPFGVAVAPNGTRVYVTNAGSASLSVLDGTSHTVLATVGVGSFPLGVAVHPSGSHVYTANNASGSVSIVNAATHAVSSTPVAVGLFGIGVTPSGSHVYAASEDMNRVYVLATATSSLVANVAVPAGPAGFGLFFVTPAACDTSELTAALEAAQQNLSQCESDLAVAASQNAALAAENQRLRTLLGASSGIVGRLVAVLFGDRPGSEVAAAVRDATAAQLDAARAVAPGDPRLRQAQRAFDEGLALLAGGDWKRALQSFREAYLMAARIQSEAVAQSRRRP